MWEYWNYPLVVVTFLMIIGCIRSHTGWLAWLGLFNWLPVFWCFWGLQPYLLTPERRKKCASWLIFESPGGWNIIGKTPLDLFNINKKNVLIVAHGNSLRALVKYLDKISDENILKLNIPTGIPLVYELDEELLPPKKV